MSSRRSVCVVGLVSIVLLVPMAVTSARAQAPIPTSKPDTSELALPDTLPPYREIRGTSRDRSALVAAVVDALHGRIAFPPPLALKSFHRNGQSVTIDMMADSLPRIRWRNGGGTVRILSDGRRIILRRHN